MLMFAGCHQTPNPPAVLNDTLIEMYVNKIALIDFGVLSAGDFHITVADTSLIQCNDSGVVTSGRLTGATTITLTLKADQRARSTVKVTVREVIDDVEFSIFDTWQIAPGYTIYRLRYYRPGSSDTLLTRNSHYFGQDTATVLNHHFPEAGEWLHLFDATDRQGQNREVGLFLDSVATFNLYCYSATAYDIVGGYVDSACHGAVLNSRMPVFIDGDSIYVSGVKQFVDNPSDYDIYRKPGVKPNPVPGYLQSGHFNLDLYERLCETVAQINWSGSAFNGTVYEDDDSQMEMYLFDPKAYNIWNIEVINFRLGYPLATDGPNLIELVVTENSSDELRSAHGTCANYNFQAELFDDWESLSLEMEARVAKSGRTQLFFKNPPVLIPFINTRVATSASLAVPDPYLP